ncbi:MAG: Protein MraZ [Candidatus Beckwithbacteria bacterium GW2011_GWA2_43_10]|uniref:Transcriptional regulator MraZ n=1 Tax=Candidatus Beckwithbacteria bacterium GW2011_GWA2_43_10 TaxID=1618369 RepID=A0A0G1BZ73_9BACT|nr:MAG: Protein MraZ [Candidatus Beckwithbacteria bacterium GW2011_GWA2_43_10]
MFIGQYQTKVDPKGRAAMPAKFKRALGINIIITAGYESSLMIVALKDWQQVVGQVTNRGLALGPARATDRFLLGGAFEVELDRLGRFLIPKALRDYAAIAGEVVFVGVGNRIELWAENKWQEYQKFLKANISQLGEKLSA